jgi:hypothetical protein
MAKWTPTGFTRRLPVRAFKATRHTASALAALANKRKDPTKNADEFRIGEDSKDIARNAR